ncbi:MAG: MATE family efflux transporter [Haloglomus sp.]
MRSPFRSRDELEFTSGSVGWPLYHLALPVVATTLLQTVYNLTDTFWVGRYGSAELAALTFSFPLVFLFVALGSGVSTAGRVLVAQYEGAGEHERVSFVAGQTLAFSTLAALVVAAVGAVGIGPLFRAMGAAPLTRGLAFSYMGYILAGLPLLFLAYTFSALLQGYGDALTPLAVVLASVLLNLVLDPVLIFGPGPVPELGLEGAAIATLGARGAAAVAGVGLLVSDRVEPTVRMRDLWPDPSFLKRVGRVGVPASLETGAIAASVTATLFLVGRFDAPVVAGFGIGERVTSLMFLPAIGVSAATITMVGQNLGAGEAARARRAARLAVGVPLVGLTAVGLLVSAGARSIAAVFSTDAAVVTHAAAFLRVVGPAYGFEAAARVYSGVFRGAGRTDVALAVTGTTFIPVRLGLALALAWPLGYGPLGIWAGYALSGVVGAALGFLVASLVGWDEALVDGPDTDAGTDR